MSSDIKHTTRDTMSSFFCERTAEYALVPLLQCALKQHFETVVPISYWRTREGNRTSAGIHKDRSFRILVMFARRPKITSNGSVLAGRVNCDLYSFANAAKQDGVLTIAGFPAVKSIPDLHFNPQVFWLHITSVTPEYFFADISHNDRTLTDNNDNVVATLSIDDIANEIYLRTQIFTWDEAMLAIHRLRTSHRGHYTSVWQNTYKPVYFLVSAN